MLNDYKVLILNVKFKLKDEYSEYMFKEMKLKKLKQFNIIKVKNECFYFNKLFM